MKNINKAIEVEKEYLSYRMKGEYPYHLVDRIRECGFESLDEYFKEKNDYEFNKETFEVIETTPIKAIADIFTTVTSKKTALLMADTITTIVWLGDDSPYDREFCIKNNIPVLPLRTKGGTIVSTKGDLNIGICMPEKYGIDHLYILNGLANIFRKYTDKEIVIDGNDILVDGYKVLGSSTYSISGMFVFITPVSLTEKTELIQNICQKMSTKTPSHMDFITAEQLRQEVRSWLTHIA